MSSALVAVFCALYVPDKKRRRALPHVIGCEFSNGQLSVACEASERNLLDVLGARRHDASVGSRRHQGELGAAGVRRSGRDVLVGLRHCASGRSARPRAPARERGVKTNAQVMTVDSEDGRRMPTLFAYVWGCVLALLQNAGGVEAPARDDDADKRAGADDDRCPGGVLLACRALANNHGDRRDNQRDEEHCFRTAGRCTLALPFIGNQLEGLVSRDLLPLPVAALGSLDAQHGCLDAVGVVYAIDARQAFRTDAGPFLFGQFSCRRAHYLAIAHMHVQVAAAVAVAAAYAGVNRLFARA